MGKEKNAESKFKTTEVERRAKAKWQAKNRRKSNYYSQKSHAKAFVRVGATKEDLLELYDMVKERIKEWE